MKGQRLAATFLDTLRGKVPQRAKLTTLLMDLLLIEKEAVYRRLRGEVPFTFQEVATITTALGISVDDLIGNSLERVSPAKITVTEFSDLKDVDYEELERFNTIFETANVENDTELCEVANTIPHSIFYDYIYLTRFYLFKWTQQHGSTDVTRKKKFGEIEISPRLRQLQMDYRNAKHEVSKTSFVFDFLIFNYLINEIMYYSSIKMIEPWEKKNLKEDILQLIDNLELLAGRGTYEDTGNKVSCYISTTNFETCYSYMKLGNLHLVMVKLFVLNAVTSVDREIYKKFQNWANAMKRASTLISESGEKERVKFFETQRELVSSSL